jgi:hypothetical protein
MHVAQRSFARAVGFAVLAVAGRSASAAGSGAGSMTPSASVTTAIQGWESYFKLDWTVQPKSNGNEIDGYVHNTYGSPAANVQVLAQALDDKGNVVGQKVEWVPGNRAGPESLVLQGGRPAGGAAVSRVRVGVRLGAERGQRPALSRATSGLRR